MPPKKVLKFSVIHLKQNTESESKVVTVPCNWIKENQVTYSEIPLTEDDKEMVDSFLQLAMKLTTTPPASWPKYQCTVLESFGV